jgi:hypothetical protein
MTFLLALDELVSSVFATDSQVAFPPFSLLQHHANINSSHDVCQTSTPPSAHAASGMCATFIEYCPVKLPYFIR